MIRWTGADTGGSGIGHYELERSTDGGATWLSLAASTSALQATTSVPSSGTVAFRVRAVDLATNVGAWSTGAILTPRLVQDSSASIKWAKTWTKQSTSSFSGGSVRWAKAKAASATITATGTSFAFVTTKASNRGWVRIYVNGTLKARINLASARTKARAVVWQMPWASPTAATIRVYVEGTAGRPRVDLDALVVVR
jgi:hypothetical protein